MPSFRAPPDSPSPPLDDHSIPNSTYASRHHRLCPSSLPPLPLSLASVYYARPRYEMARRHHDLLTTVTLWPPISRVPIASRIKAPSHSHRTSISTAESTTLTHRLQRREILTLEAPALSRSTHRNFPFSISQHWVNTEPTPRSHSVP